MKKFLSSLVLLLSFNCLAAQSHYSMELSYGYFTCNGPGPNYDEPMVAHFGPYDEMGRCLDNPELTCSRLVTFFDFGEMKGLNGMCALSSDAPKCFETSFNLVNASAENFLEITDEAFASGVLVKEDKTILSKKTVLNKWRKFIQVHGESCDYMEIRYKFIERK